MGGVAKCTIGLNSLTVGVKVPNLNDAGKGEECTAKEAHSDPQRTMDSRIPAALQHAPIIYTQSQVTQFVPAFCHATANKLVRFVHPRDNSNSDSRHDGHRSIVTNDRVLLTATTKTKVP